MNSKIHLRKNTSNLYFKTISHYLRVYSLSGFTVGRSINELVFFFAAFAEVQVTVLSVLNLPRQGFPATCPVGHCCVCNPWLFASEIFCDLPTYNKQRINKIEPKSLHVLPGNPKCTMKSCCMASLGFVYGLLLGNFGYQTDRKIYDQSEIAVHLGSSRDTRAARATNLIYRFSQG